MYIMKSRKKEKMRGGGLNLESCTDTGFECPKADEGKTEFCKPWIPTGSVCYSEKCYTPANCAKATDPGPADGKSGSNNLINGVVGVAGLGAMYMGYKWLNKKKASSDDSSSPEKMKSSRRKRKSSRRKRKSSRRKSISYR
jgi:hypothetical protein